MTIDVSVIIEGQEDNERICTFVIVPRIGEVVRIPGRDFAYEVVKVSHQATDRDDQEPRLKIVLARRRAGA